MSYQKRVDAARKHAKILRRAGGVGPAVARSLENLIREIRKQRHRRSKALQRARRAERLLRTHNITIDD